MTIPLFSPPGFIKYPVSRAPLQKTFHQESVSGKDNPLAMWSYPRWRWTMSFALMRSAAAFLELQYMATFFNSMNGSVGVFQYTDVHDNAVTAQDFGIGDGTTSNFQLTRTMASAIPGGGWTEPVLATTGTPIAYINGVPAAATFAAGGQVTFASPPGVGTVLTWTGSYNWLCRFDDDTIGLSEFMSNFWSLSKLSFTSIKL